MKIFEIISDFCVLHLEKFPMMRGSYRSKKDGHKVNSLLKYLKVSVV